MRILKYKLTLIDRQSIRMPWTSKMLSVQIQDNEIQLWALVDEDSSKEDKIIAIYGTGENTPIDPGEYIGTIQYSEYVWHVFEIKKPKYGV